MGSTDAALARAVNALTDMQGGWALVAPSPLAPEGFVNVATGETHLVVW